MSYEWINVLDQCKQHSLDQENGDFFVISGAL